MGKTSSRLNSRLCSRLCLVSALVSAPLVLPVAGCVTGTRIEAPNATLALPRTDTDPKLCVVDCVLEMHSTSPMVAIPGAKNAVATHKVEGLQTALRAACPEWFESGADSVPVCVKILADVTDFGRLSIPFELRTPLMVNPGEWSDATPISARRAIMKLAGDYLGDDIPSSVHPFAPVFSLMEDLKDCDGPGGADPDLARILANEIVKTWQGLSYGEKRSVMLNPVAAKRKMELYPETEAAVASSNTGFSVPEAPGGEFRKTGGVPAVAGYGYNKASRRGFVEFDKNGAEHLAALKWAREEIIPKIAGDGVAIRIVSEKTLKNGNSRIDFEVVQ